MGLFFGMYRILLLVDALTHAPTTLWTLLNQALVILSTTHNASSLTLRGFPPTSAFIVEKLAVTCGRVRHS